MLKNLKISQKLYVGFGVVIALLLAIVGLNYFNYQSIDRGTQTTQEVTYPILRTANEMVLATIQVQQFCSDIGATRAQDGYDDGLDKAKEFNDRFWALLDSAIALDPDHGEELSAMRAPFEEYYQTGVKMANAYIEGGPALGNKMMDEFDSDAIRINSLVNDYYGEVEKSFYQDLENIEHETMTANTVSMAVAGIAVVMAMLISFFVARLISKPMLKVVALTDHMNNEFDQFVEVVERIAQNDFTARIEQSRIENIGIDSHDEVGLLVRAIEATLTGKNRMGVALEKMISNLSSLIRQLTDNARELASASTEIASASEQMTRGANDQSQQVSQVSAAVEEMSATIVQSSKNAAEATEASRNASETATAGGQVVSDTINGMQAIANVVRESAESIAKLASSADQIGEIIGVIDDIADQTNLLALNAAIEAARAGEQGRGFAVVADEVRKLAERTGKATGEITEMIKGIQNETEDAVKSMEAGSQEVDKGRELTDKAGSSLNEIVTVSQRVMDMIQQIATASEEQSVAAEQISKNVERITSVSAENARGAEQSAAAAEQLSRQAEGLQLMINRFKISGGGMGILELAKDDHRRYMENLESVINGDRSPESWKHTTHKECRFGKWYYSGAGQSYASYSAYHEIENAHKQIHRYANEAVSAKASHDTERAKRLFDQTEAASHIVIEKIGALEQQIGVTV